MRVGDKVYCIKSYTGYKKCLIFKKGEYYTITDMETRYLGERPRKDQLLETVCVDDNIYVKFNLSKPESNYFYRYFLDLDGIEKKKLNGNTFQLIFRCINDSILRWMRTNNIFVKYLPPPFERKYIKHSSIDPYGEENWEE